jgi:hypothetical protein
MTMNFLNRGDNLSYLTVSDITGDIRELDHLYDKLTADDGRGAIDKFVLYQLSGDRIKCVLELWNRGIGCGCNECFQDIDSICQHPDDTSQED